MANCVSHVKGTALLSRRDEVVDVAERVLEAEGPEALTMRRLGEELGMRAPSLYKHVTGKDDIVAALQARALQGQAAALAGDTTLTALAGSYRAWALAHPRLYDLISRRSLDRAHLPPGVEAAAAAPLLRAVGGDVARARALWGLAHGLVDLELAGRFPADADLGAAWSVAVAAFAAADR
jgi:AcrR family transcriptional regulator